MTNVTCWLCPENWISVADPTVIEQLPEYLLPQTVACISLPQSAWHKTDTDRPIPFFLAKSSIIAVGSEPIDSRQIIGVRVSLSSHMARRSRITGSAYFGPIESAMYLRACDVVLSGHHDLQRKHTDIALTALSVLLHVHDDNTILHLLKIPKLTHFES